MACSISASFWAALPKREASAPRMVTDPDCTSAQINPLVSVAHSPLSPAGRHHNSRVEGASLGAGPPVD